ncbi:MAG TPA: cysteine desulfurase-like protein [Amnibacterium sp.]|jgi:cysteine desulfurase family protein (TIGR01976 family)|uniref:cysteine desulfurase-like protein n=1 Tax=Amnibacterium sp. TaxID=1872496 RepID=UPI002F93B8A2
MAFDTASFRALFPSLDSGIAHFDGPGGTQTPLPVAEAITRVLVGPLSNRGRATASERNADEAVVAFREAVAGLTGGDPRGVVYGRSATQLAYDFARHLGRHWTADDEVVVSRLDHDSNVRPWVQAAERAGAQVRWIDFDPETGELDLDSATAAIGPRTRLVAVTGASNLIGTKPPVRSVADLAHAAGALVWVDGVHLAAHTFVDVRELGADFFVCSAYKFLGPHCSALAADPALLETIEVEKLAPSTDVVPERFEYGTLPYEQMAGVTAAIDLLASLGDADASAPRRERLASAFAVLHEHEARLIERLEAGLATFGDRVVLHSRAADRTPTQTITFRDRSTADAARFLTERDIALGSSDFYAYEAAIRLGLPDSAGLRMGVAPYTTEDEVDRLLTGLRAFLES